MARHRGWVLRATELEKLGKEAGAQAPKYLG